MNAYRCNYRAFAQTFSAGKRKLSFVMYLTDRKASGKIYQAKNRLSPFLGTFEKLGKATISFVISVCLSLSVCPHGTTRSPPPTGSIFMKFNICIFFQNLSRKFKFHYNRTRITGSLHEGQCIYFPRPIWSSYSHARNNDIYDL
jgi:hypothetical protein